MTDHPMLLLLLPASLLLAACAGWLAVLEARPLRFWARYPWRVFCAAYVFSLAFPPPLRPGAVYVGLLFAACLLVVMYVSAVHGLRSSWHRSPVGGVLVLAGGFGLGVVGAVLHLLRTAQWHRLDLMVLLSFAAVLYWALMALVAERVARRLGGDPRAALERPRPIR